MINLPLGSPFLWLHRNKLCIGYAFHGLLRYMSMTRHHDDLPVLRQFREKLERMSEPFPVKINKQIIKQ